jgi:hypothetical protein
VAHTFRGEARKAGRRRTEHLCHKIDIPVSDNPTASTFLGFEFVAHHCQNMKRLEITNVNDSQILQHENKIEMTGIITNIKCLTMVIHWKIGTIRIPRLMIQWQKSFLGMVITSR